MTVGPLRRLTAGLGLLALVPITWLLATGALTPEEAALRALVVVIVVVALGRLLGAVVTRLLHRIERRASDRSDTGDGAPSTEVGADPQEVAPR